MAAVPNAASVDMTGVLAAASELRRIRSRLRPEMRRATVASAKAVQNKARASIRAQTSGKTTGWYPTSITYEVKESNANSVFAVIGPETANRGHKPTMGLILEFGTSKQGPKPHLNPAFQSEWMVYMMRMGAAAERAVFP